MLPLPRSSPTSLKSNIFQNISNWQNALWTSMEHLAPAVREDKKKMRFLVVGMHLGGMNAEEIADSLMIPRRTVSFWLHKFHHRGDVEDDSRSGRPRSTSNTADRRLLRLCRSDRLASSAMLLSDWGENVTDGRLSTKHRQSQIFKLTKNSRAITVSNRHQIRK